MTSNRIQAHALGVAEDESPEQTTRRFYEMRADEHRAVRSKLEGEIARKNAEARRWMFRFYGLLIVFVCAVLYLAGRVK